jgi:hypothetical protein
MVGGFALGAFLYGLVAPPGIQFGDEFAGVEWAGFILLGSAASLLSHMGRRADRGLLHGIAGFVGLALGTAAGLAIGIASHAAGWLPRRGDGALWVLIGLAIAGSGLGFAAGSLLAARVGRRRSSPEPEP